jgi:DNA-binding transcriptional regulator LsrR (DeoR family)
LFRNLGSPAKSRDNHAVTKSERADAESGQGRGARFDDALLYRAAIEYYQNDATQAEVAAILEVSRPTVSRILAEAKRRGIVRIEVMPPVSQPIADLSAQVARVLSLTSVHLSAPMPPGNAPSAMGPLLAPAVGRALSEVGMLPGDVLLVSSGRTVYEVAGQELPPLPGVLVTPTIGGQDQPEGWYQTNEIARRIAGRIGGRANYLFAPALPGPELHRSLMNDASIHRVIHLWPHATCALVGIGAPPLTRSDLPRFVPVESVDLRLAVGDVCSRFYDRDGAPLRFDGDDRLFAVQLDVLRRVPVVIAVAAGANKVESIVAGARGGYFTTLVTDPATAAAVVAYDHPGRGPGTPNEG